MAAAAAFAQETRSAMDRIAATGAITIGHREASIPFSYLDDSKRPVGYAIDLCQLFFFCLGNCLD